MKKIIKIIQKNLYRLRLKCIRIFFDMLEKDGIFYNDYNSYWDLLKKK